MSGTTEASPAATRGPILLCPLEHERRGLVAAGIPAASIATCGPGREGIRRWADRHPSLRRPVIMVGLAGGLDPTLDSGTVVVADEIVDPQGRVWTPTLAELLPEDLPRGRVATAGRLVASPEAKVATARATGAVLVDLESTHFAEVARQRGWHWGVVRVVGDTAREPVPTALERFVDHRGRTRPAVVAAELFRRPTLLPTLRRLQATTRVALDALAGALGRVDQLDATPAEPAGVTASVRDTGPPTSLVFGGTFDPPHRGHVGLSFEAARRLGCRELIFVPARINPLKVETPPTDAEVRVRMLEAAIAAHRAEHGDAALEARVSRLEIDRDGPSYMVDTLRQLQAELFAAAGEAATDPQHRPRMRLLIGSDQALQFTRWKDWREIVALAPPAVMPRPPQTRATLAGAYRDHFPSDLATRWSTWTLDLPTDQVSGTEIRRRLAAGERPGELLSAEVLRIVDELGLYRDDSDDPPPTSPSPSSPPPLGTP